MCQGNGVSGEILYQEISESARKELERCQRSGMRLRSSI